METIADAWARMCQDAVSHAHDAHLVPLFPWASGLLAELTQRFVNLTAPCDASELDVRKLQERGFERLRDALLDANDYAKLTNLAAIPTIASECEKLMKNDFPATEEQHRVLDHQIRQFKNTVHQF